MTVKYINKIMHLILFLACHLFRGIKWCISSHDRNYTLTFPHGHSSVRHMKLRTLCFQEILLWSSTNFTLFSIIVTPVEVSTDTTCNCGIYSRIVYLITSCISWLNGKKLTWVLSNFQWTSKIHTSSSDLDLKGQQY